MISKEEWVRGLNAEIKFGNMTLIEAEEKRYRDYNQQGKGKELEGYLTQYKIPKGFTSGRTSSGDNYNTDGSVRRSIVSTLKNWWSIIKGE